MEQSPWNLQWNDSLSVDIPEIDREHQHFIQLVNDFNRAIIDRMDLPEIRNGLKAITEDATRHFAHEEELFGQWHYPEAERHALIHRTILSSLSDMMEKLCDTSTMYAWIEIGLKIKQTLIRHIIEDDMKYGDFRRSASC